MADSMDLTRAHAILAELDGEQLDDIDMEIAHPVEEGDIDFDDPGQLDEWPTE